MLSGIGLIFEASSIRSRISFDTGYLAWVRRLTAIIAIVEETTPATIGAIHVYETTDKNSQKKATIAPVKIDARAPGVFAFFHQTAQT